MPRFPAAADRGARTSSDGPEQRHVFYVHGFASSPRSAKARYLHDRCAEAGLAFHCPDFNLPSFETLTISRMLGQLDAAVASVAARDVVLVGSSLGGLVAWLAAGAWQVRSEHRWRVSHLFLMAPAFGFGGNRARDLGDSGLRAWRETGWREFFHYGEGAPRRVHYDLFADAAQHDPAAVRVDVPTLVFQGSRDAVVTPRSVATFSAARPNITLVSLDDDHQLVESLPTIWSRMRVPLLEAGS